MAEEVSFADAASQIAASAPARPRIDSSRLKRFLKQQPDVSGPVELGDLAYIEDAGGSNGIALFDARIDGRLERFVLRYAPGEQLLKQKRFDEEFLTLAAVHGKGIPAPMARWCDPTCQAIGYPFLVMERLVGRAPAN